MSFNIHNKVAKEGITKEQLLNSEFAKVLDEGRKSMLESIFDKFNTNKEGDSKDKLDKDELKEMLGFFKTMSGDDSTVTDEEFNAAKQNSTIAEKFADGAAKIDYSHFMQAYQEVAETVETEDYVPESGSEDDEPGEHVKPKYAPRGRVSLPTQWNNKRLDDGVAEELKLNDMTTAQEVLDKLMEKFGISGDDLQKDKLLADLIKYNPSVFDKDGNVYSDAKWDRLDFPADAGELYKTGATIPTVQQRAPQQRGGAGEGPDRITNIPQDDPPGNIPGKAPSAYDNLTMPLPDFNSPALNTFRYKGRPDSMVNDGRGNVYVYNEEGYLSRIEDTAGNVKYQYFDFNPDYNYLEGYNQIIESHNTDGKHKQDIRRNHAGRVENIYDRQYNQDGEIVSEIERDAHGMVTSYKTTEYIEHVHRREIYRTPDGNIGVEHNDPPPFDYSYSDLTYETRTIAYHSADGKVVALSVVVNDHFVFYHPDGTKWE